MILQRSRLIVQYCKSQGIERETSPSIFFMCYSKTCFYSSFLLGFGSSTVKLAEKVYGKIGGKKDLWLGLTVSYFFKLREIRSCTKQVTVSPSFDRFAKLKENTKLGKKSVSKQCFVSYFCIFSFKLCTFSSSFVLSIRHTHPLLPPPPPPFLYVHTHLQVTSYHTHSSNTLTKHTHQTNNHHIHSPHTLTTHTHNTHSQHTLITHTHHTHSPHILTTHTHHTHSPLALITHIHHTH